MPKLIWARGQLDGPHLVLNPILFPAGFRRSFGRNFFCLVRVRTENEREKKFGGFPEKQKKISFSFKK